MFEALAHQRKRQNGGDRKSEKYQKSEVEIFPPPIESNSKARDEAAAALCTNPRYVSDAKRIAEEARF
jgi:hypothetical protein